jgi:hypothetical protein
MRSRRLPQGRRRRRSSRASHELLDSSMDDSMSMEVCYNLFIYIYVCFFLE